MERRRTSRGKRISLELELELLLQADKDKLHQMLRVQQGLLRGTIVREIVRGDCAMEVTGGPLEPTLLPLVLLLERRK